MYISLFRRCSIFLPPEVSKDISNQLSAAKLRQVMMTKLLHGRHSQESRQRRQSSISSEWTVGMLEYESGPEGERVSDFDCRERFLSGADTIASEISQLCPPMTAYDSQTSPGTRPHTYESIIRRREYNKVCDSYHDTDDEIKFVARRSAIIVDDKVADHASLLRFVLS